MDSLQHAIEKARQEREGRIGQTTAPGESGLSKVESGTTGTGAHRQSGISTTNRPGTKDTIGANASERGVAARNIFLDVRQILPDEAALSRNRVIAADVNDARVEVYRQLRTQVLGKMKSHNWRTLAITSAHENAGKTLTAVNLAISIAQDASQSVMLVDLDLLEPNVNTTLATDINKGIVDYLMHDEPLESIVFSPGVPRMVVLPGVPQGRHASEILSSPAMDAFLEELATYDSNCTIIFDLPPLLRNDDAMVFAPKVDACLLVVEDGVTRPADIERSMQLLGQSSVIGTVLNKSR